MSDTDQVTVTENTSVVRDPVTGEAHQVVERTVTESNQTNWALWVAGIAVFGTVLILALVFLGQNNNQTDADVLAAQAEAEAARAQADQAILDANQARMDAAVTGLSVGSQNANSAAAASAAAAEAAAARADAAADSARSAPPVVVQAPPAEPTGGSDLPPTQ